MREQVRELLTGYGKIDIIWFDFSYPERTATAGCPARAASNGRARRC